MDYKHYHGTYKVRSIGHGEQGIHMPSVLSGDYAIYERHDGVVELQPAGRVAKV